MHGSPVPRRLSGFLAVLFLASVASCTSSPKAGPSGESAMEGKESVDTLHLTTKEVRRGQIVGITESYVLLRTEDGTSQISRGAIYEIKYSDETLKRLNTPPPQPVETPKKVAVSTWYPRNDSREAVSQTEVTFFDEHPFTGDGSCVGKLADTYVKIPELRLFVPAGGKIVLDDRRIFGYHAHAWPSGFYKPVGKPGLIIPVGPEDKDVPEAIAFVTPKQEMTSTDGPEKKSVAISDCIYSTVKPLGAAQATLAVQPWAGGKPQKTKYGDLWAVGLPRNKDTWYVYLHDDEKRSHSKYLKSTFAVFGNTVLEANVAINVEDKDGFVTGRVMVVSVPDEVAADGDAPILICAGTLADPLPLVSVGLPPRATLVTPSAPAATKANLAIHHHRVAKETPETVVIAYGTGQATGDVTVLAHELTPAKSDDEITVDMSGKAEDAFPQILWLYSRRTFAWRTSGGMLPMVPPLPAQQDLPDAPKLTRAKWAPPLSHVTPILFRGPKPPTFQGYRSDPAAGLAGGMANGLAQDALMREAGGTPLGFTNNVGTPGMGGSGASNWQNYSIVNITVPPPGPGGLAGGGGAGAILPPASGMHLQTTPGWAPTVGAAPWAHNPATQLSGTRDAQGNYYNNSGQQTFNDRQAAQQYYGAQTDPGVGANGLDPITGRPVINFTRKNK